MTNTNRGIIPTHETVSDRCRGDDMGRALLVGDRAIAEVTELGAYTVQRIERPVQLPVNQRWAPGVYAINYEPGHYPDLVMPDTDGWDLVSADGTVYNPSEGDVVTLLTPTGVATAALDGFNMATTAALPLNRQDGTSSKELSEALSLLDPDSAADRQLMNALRELIREHTRERDSDEIRPSFTADTHFTNAGAPDALVATSTINVERNGAEAHSYRIGRGTGSGFATTWVGAALYGLAYTAPVAD